MGEIIIRGVFMKNKKTVLAIVASIVIVLAAAGCLTWFLTVKGRAFDKYISDVYYTTDMVLLEFTEKAENAQTDLVWTESLRAAYYSDPEMYIVGKDIWFIDDDGEVPFPSFVSATLRINGKEYVAEDCSVIFATGIVGGGTNLNIGVTGIEGIALKFPVLPDKVWDYVDSEDGNRLNSLGIELTVTLTDINGNTIKVSY
jgi:hypothetical protein